jgi:histidine phosphotransfer protein HptB
VGDVIGSVRKITQFPPLRPVVTLHYVAPSNSVMPDVAIIDLQAIENLRALNPGDDGAFLREIAGIFLEDTPQRLAELEQSLRERDVARFARAAHSIKGSSANLGANSLRSVAEKLEHQARTEGIDQVATLLEQVNAEFAKASRELGKLVGA